MNRIRILQIVSGVDIGDRSGGAELHAAKVAGLFDRSRFKSRIFALRSFNSEQEKLWIEKMEEQEIIVEGLLPWKGSVLGSLFRAYTELRKCVSAFRPHIVHSHSERTDALSMTVHLFHTIHPLAVRTVHLDQQWKTRPLLSWLVPEILFPLSFDHEIAVSQAIRNKLSASRIRKPEKISLCHNGIDLSEFSNQSVDTGEYGQEFDLSRPLLGVVGRLATQKGHSNLLDALSLVDEGLRVQLLVIGDGPLDLQLKNQAIRLGLGDSIKFLGIRNDVMKLLSMLTLFVLPSRWEGFPTVILEAMSKKVTVIATDIPGTRELVRNNDTGLLVPVDDPQALAAAITTVLEDPDKARNMADRAYRFASQFTIDETATCYERIYAALVDQKKPPVLDEREA